VSNNGTNAALFKRYKIRKKNREGDVRTTDTDRRRYAIALSHAIRAEGRRDDQAIAEDSFCGESDFEREMLIPWRRR